MSNPLNPSLMGIRLGTLAHLYWRRVRADTLGELLAGSGIAVGVALVFGVLLAGTSITGSASELVHGVVGEARLALVARSANGMPEALAERVARLPGVQVAAPILQQDGAIEGPRGRRAVQMIGVTPAVVSLGGSATRHLNGGILLEHGGIGLPSDLAGAVGARRGQAVTVLAAGLAHRASVAAVLGSSTIGPVAHSPVAVGLVGLVQRLAGRPGRVSQVLVEPYSGMDATVRRELHRLAGDRLDVVSAENELRQLRTTSAANSQATDLFAAIGGMVGFLLAFNAMLLTVPERRRTIADLRMQGFDWRQALLTIGFEALVLGAMASVVGIVLGDLASHAFLHRVPVYLSFAFPIGSQESVGPQIVGAGLGCGLTAALVASGPVIADLRPGRGRDAVLRHGDGDAETVAGPLAGRLAACGAGLVLAVSAIAIALPSLTLLGGVLLALATLLLLPATFAGFGRAAVFVNERVASTALVVACRELREVGVRTVALAGVGALAVFGSVAIGGARHDLLAGSNVNFGEYLGTADLWVTTGGNDLTTNSFHPGTLARRLAALSAVASVRAYQGELMDVGSRRIWVVARPPQDATIVPHSQVLEGNAAHAERLVRGGGWAAVSNGLARERGLRVGNRLQLPTPSGWAQLRVAAVVTNVGWPPGAVILNNADYARYWITSEPSAFEVTLRAGTSEATGKQAVEQALRSTPGLAVQTRAERRAQYAADSRQVLESLGEISLLLLLAAGLAVAAALSTAIWQRRPALAALKLQGYDHRQLWRALVIESAIMLGVGCTVGAVMGVYGHMLASRWLKLSNGFPAPFSMSLAGMAADFALVAGIAMLVVSAPGLLAARVSARLALQDT